MVLRAMLQKSHRGKMLIAVDSVDNRAAASAAARSFGV